MDYVKYIRGMVGTNKIILNCAGTLVIKDHKLLIQRRADNGEWGLVGGLLEMGETYEEAAVRETFEETGLKVHLDEFLGIYYHRDMEWPSGDKAFVIGAYYIASVVSGELKVDEESLELKFVDLDELPYFFAEDHRDAVRAYLKKVKA
ncbi:MAG: NUDIX domain-containing protein [Erysipelotrichaceae bacterium]|nr:NUDIX domain-containing protein [Erysipelotrichaceae bacterium]